MIRIENCERAILGAISNSDKIVGESMQKSLEGSRGDRDPSGEGRD